jgi:hypothetical protein
VAVTLEQLRTRVRLFIRDPNANTVPNAEIDQCVNDALRDTASFLSKQEGDFLLREATSVLVNAQVDYTYPADIFGRNIRALWTYAPSGATSYCKVERATLEEVFSLGTRSAVYPTKYCCLDGYFKIGPPPDASGYLLRINYIRQPTVMTNPGDNMDADDEFKELIAVSAAIRALEPRGGVESIQMLTARQQALMTEAARLITKEDTIQAYPAWKY